MTKLNPMTRRSLREKASLRAACQEAVHEFTLLRHEVKVMELVKTGAYTEKEARSVASVTHPVIEEYDPVVELCLVGANPDVKVDLRVTANSNAAKYLRPALKSVELLEDPEDERVIEAKRVLCDQLVDLLDTAATAKRSSVKKEVAG